MVKEGRSDWCWSNEALIIIPLLVIIAAIILWNMFTIRPQGTFGAGMEVLAIFMIGSFFVTCYLCGKIFEIASDSSNPQD